MIIVTFKDFYQYKDALKKPFVNTQSLI